MSQSHGYSHQTTLAEVARAAGVSIPTVSKVVNGRADVSEATRARVKQLLREHDYVCRPYGRRRLARPAITLVFDTMESPYSMEIARGVMTAATDDSDGASVTLAPSASSGHSWADPELDSGQDGLILVTSGLAEDQRQQLAHARTPVVLIDPINVPSPGVISIGCTNWDGSVAAARHLLELGHRRIATIVGRPDTSFGEAHRPGFRAAFGEARLHGFRAAMAAAGVPHDPGLVRTGPFRFESGYEHAVELLSSPGPPTAIFASSDVQALGVIAATRRLGISVPEQLSVMSFDGTFAARWSAPPLTAVHRPFADMGRAATRTLLQLIAGREPARRCIRLATSLMVRESTAPPARDSESAAISGLKSNRQPLSYAR